MIFSESEFSELVSATYNRLAAIQKKAGEQMPDRDEFFHQVMLARVRDESGDHFTAAEIAQYFADNPPEPDESCYGDYWPDDV